MIKMFNELGVNDRGNFAINLRGPRARPSRRLLSMDRCLRHGGAAHCLLIGNDRAIFTHLGHI